MLMYGRPVLARPCTVDKLPGGPVRFVSACVLVLLWVGLLLAPGHTMAAASAGHTVVGTCHKTSEDADFQALGESTYSISGHVLNYAGKPMSGVEVDWGWSGSSYYHSGGSNVSPAHPKGTGRTGAFRFARVTGGHPRGDRLDVSYKPTSFGLEEMVSFDLDFAAGNDATHYSYEMQPAHVGVNIAHAPATRLVEIRAGNANVGEGRADVILSAGTGVASVLPMTNFDDVVAYCYGAVGNCTAQTEWLGAPVTVSAGTTATSTVDLDWDTSQFARLAGPTCRHSGTPGTIVKLLLKGWPAGEKAAFVASCGASQYRYPQSQTSSAASDTYTVPLQIRTNAPVDSCKIVTYRADDYDSLVGLWDYFEVCTFRASASAIHRGMTVRLSGKVPGRGYVTIYSTRHEVSGQPWSLAAKGWVKGGRYPISSSGKFLTGVLRPTRTISYVAKYTGINFPAFTSMVKVSVR